VAQGETAQVELDAVKQSLTLTVTDVSGKTATDIVTIDPVSKARVLLSEGFGGGDFAAWTIVDEGESGGVGVDGKSSQWELRDGALVQLSGLTSRQLTWNGASNSDPWQTGWSPLGDGVNVLRKGTYALYNEAAAKEWSDYAVEATITSPDNGALGLLFYYQDANNYYKLELDANGDYDRNPRNGAGSLFQLIQVKDGVERYLNQYPAKYTPGEAVNLRVEVKDGKIQAYVDGLALFAYAIEDRAQTKGTIGLFSWDSAGVSFDNVLVYDLLEASVLPPGGEIIGTPGDDVLSGTVGADVILAGLGDDEVAGGAGDDVIDGGEGDDTLLGEAGDDLLKGGDGDDRLFGGVGNDVLVGGAGDDLLDGGEGIDTADYSTDTAGVTVNLAEGYAEGDEAGSDELVSIENVIGGAGNDVLKGDGGDNVFIGGAGNDVIDGRGGFDTLDLSGATGPVSVDFAAGTVSGAGLGSDRFMSIEKLLFGAGDDIVIGGNGDDAFDGGAGNDTLKGGAGDDTLWGGAGDDTLDGGSGHDEIFGGIGNDMIRAGSGDDRIEAGEGDDIVDAGSGDDIVLGGAGNDIIDGGSGADRIEGGAGDDILTGGSGHDVFVFAAGFGKDVITDFKTTGSSSDVLEFDVDLFADFDDAMDAASQVGADTVFTIDADTSVMLKGVQLTSLAVDDFRFV
jgi:Ca2+-binding RTX toxin-like protein